jgi:predicted anti-sigma-YlaC factor YlaD
LREHERFPSLGGQRREEKLELDPIGKVGLHVRAARQEGVDRTPPLCAANCIGADPAGDREQPDPYRAAPLEARERSKRPGVGLLHEIVGFMSAPEVRTESEDVILGLAHEFEKRDAVPRGGRAHQIELVPHLPHVRWELNDPSGRLMSMECTRIREAISASIDGEDAGTARTEVDAHLRRCAACREFEAQALVQRGQVRFMRIDAPAAATASIARAVDHRQTQLFTMPVRIALVGVAVAQLGLAVPGLLYGSDEGAPIHIAHEVGSWSLALAVGFLFAAWRPLRAVGMLPFVGALAAGLLFTAGLDLAHGKALALDESSHLLELVGTGLLWLLVHPRARRELVPV